jgi:hypothetical protein
MQGDPERAQTRGQADAKQCYAEIECGGSGRTEPKSEKADNSCRDKTNFGTVGPMAGSQNALSCGAPPIV